MKKDGSTLAMGQNGFVLADGKTINTIKNVGSVMKVDQKLRHHTAFISREFMTGPKQRASKRSG